MNSHRLGWMVLGTGIVASIAWAAMSGSQRDPMGDELPHAQQVAPPSPPSVILEASDPLSTTRAPVQDETITPVVATQAPTSTSRDHGPLSILVIDRATRALLPDMGVQWHFGPLEMDYNSNSMHGVGPIYHTDARGRVEIENPWYSERVLLTAWDPAGRAGSACVHLESNERPVGDIVLELSPDNDFVLWMKIVDEETGHPIAGAHDTRAIDMSLPSTGGIPSYMSGVFGGQPNAESDAHGLLLLSGPAWTAHEPKLWVPGHATVWVSMEKGHERPDKAMLVTTLRSASVRVHLIDTAGLPVGDCKVSLRTQSNQQMRPRPAQENTEGPGSWWTGNTDGSGHALIEGLSPNIVLHAQTNGTFTHRIPGELTLEPGETRDVEWVVADGATLRGTLTDQSGAPIPDCEVWLLRTLHQRPGYFDEQTGQPDRRARTDASGRFVFTAAELGHFWVGPGRLDYNPEKLRTDVAPLASITDVVARAEMNIELRAARGLYVRGSVIPPAGEPLGEGFVLVQDHDRGLSMRSGWSTDGTFSVGPLTSGPQTVFAQTTSKLAPSEPIVVDAGTDGLKLQLGVGATISGRVFDVGGGGVQCKVSVSRHDTLPTAWYTSAWSSTAEFTFTGLSAGKYDLAAYSNGMKLATLGGVEVAQGGVVRDLVLQLEPSGQVRIQSELPHWYCVCQFEQAGLRMGEVKYEPFSSLYMPSRPGKVLVRLRNTETNEQIERTVNVEVGKTTVVRLDDQEH